MLNSQPLFWSRLCCLVLLISLWRATSDQSIFSGVYRPSLSFLPDDASGAFLIKQQRFVNTMSYAMKMTAYHTHKHTDEFTIDILLRGQCATCMNLQTRDFLDYFVESLSNTIENVRVDQRDAVNHLSRGLRRTILDLQAVSEASPLLDKRQEQTAAVLVFNSDVTRRISTRLKLLFFQATFWSVYRYHKHIYIMVKSITDYEMVVDMQLPQLKIVNLGVSLGEATQGMKYTAVVSFMHGTLIKQSIEYAATQFVSTQWAHYKYLYFSVGDQLLHARNFQSLYNVLDSGSEGNFLLTPHRMQTLLVAQAFTPEAQFALWPDRAENVTVFTGPMRRKRSFYDPPATAQDNRKSASNKGSSSIKTKRVISKTPAAQWQPGIELITESLTGVQGSCCDQGRILFPDCPKKPTLPKTTYFPSLTTKGKEGKEEGRQHNARQSKPQWATCTEWGASNFSTWMRVGNDGFTIPPVTTHLSHCRFSAEKELCPLPPHAASSSYGSGACQRVPVPVQFSSDQTDADSGGGIGIGIGDIIDTHQRHRNQLLLESSFQQQEPLQGEEEEQQQQQRAGKVYLHCSEMSTVRYDPQTEHLLSRSMRETLQHFIN